MASHCPRCSAQVASGAAFCPACGVAQPGGRGSGSVAESPSLFELPSSRPSRLLRVATVLTLDVILAGAGVAMIVSYFNARAEAAAPLVAAASGPDAAPRRQADVEVSPPKVLRPGDKTPRPVDVPPVSSKPPGPSTPSTPTTPPKKPPASGGGTSTPGDDGNATPDEVLGGLGGGRRPDAGPPPPPPPVPIPDAAPPPPPPDPGTTPAPADAAVDTPPPPPPDTTLEEQSLANGVQRTVEGHMAQVRRCWENAAKSSSDENLPEGTIEIEFTVQPGGSAVGVKIVQNQTGSDQLATCVVALVSSWDFPRHEGDPVVFVWPFLFKASK